MNNVSDISDALENGGVTLIKRGASPRVTEEDITSSYLEFCKKMKRRAPANISLDMELSDDFGLDSINQVEFMLHLEKKFEVAIDPDMSTAVRTLGDLLDLINYTLDTDRESEAVSKGGMTDLLSQLVKKIPQFYNDVDQQDGRKLKIKGNSVYDFASANYLGLDLDRRIFDSIQQGLDVWGTHPSWSRAIASPAPYRDLEEKLSDVVGVPEVLVYPTVTLIHLGVLPMLASPDTLFLMDERAHKSIQEGVDLAYAKGAQKKYFAHNDVDSLELELEKAKELEAVYICIDGVYSMTGVDARLLEFIALCKRYPNATLYVDDAHGFGIWGENPSDDNPYGTGGGGLLRKYSIDVNEDKVIYVAGLSKAFSSLAAFITCRNLDEKKKFSLAATFINSGPCPTASLVSAKVGLEISQSPEGDEIRRKLYRLTERLVSGVQQIGLVAKSINHFPLVSVEIGTIEAVTEAANFLWSKGILITPAVYPNAPIKNSMLRFTITAANTEEEIDLAIEALELVRDQVPSAPYPEV